MHPCFSTKDGIPVFKCLRRLAPDYLAEKFKILIFTAETHVTRVRLTFQGTELQQSKGPFILGPFHCGTFYPKDSLK